VIPAKIQADVKRSSRGNSERLRSVLEALRELSPAVFRDIGVEKYIEL